MAGRKNAVITGGGGGIGRLLCKGLASEGWNVLAVDRNAISLEELRASVPPTLRERVLAVVADLADPSSPERIEELALQNFGEVGVLVNNAAVQRAGPGGNIYSAPPRFWEIDLEQWNTAFRINVTASFLLSRHFAPKMIAAGWGRIINVTTSIYSMVSGGLTPYGQSKSACEALTSIAAADLQGTGVTANVLVPGGITDTPFVPDHPTVARADMLRPESMVPPLLWLVSEAADGVSGMRINARLWDTDASPEAAFAKSSLPVAWRRLANDRVDVVA